MSDSGASRLRLAARVGRLRGAAVREAALTAVGRGPGLAGAPAAHPGAGGGDGAGPEAQRLQNYRQFMGLAREISYLESEMYQLSHLLTEQKSSLESVRTLLPAAAAAGAAARLWREEGGGGAGGRGRSGGQTGFFPSPGGRLPGRFWARRGRKAATPHHPA